MISVCDAPVSEFINLVSDATMANGRGVLQIANYS